MACMLIGEKTKTPVADNCYCEGVCLDLLEIYLLNLIVTLGMFAVLLFRAWVEHKGYRMMWKELEWQRTYSTAGRVLKAERELFTRVEGGEELYNLLLEIFKAKQE